MSKPSTTATDNNILRLSAEQTEVAARYFAIDASRIMEHNRDEDDPAALLTTYDDLTPVAKIIRELREDGCTVEIDAVGDLMFELRKDMLQSVGQSKEDIERIREGDPMPLCRSDESVDEAVQRAEKCMEWEAKEARIAGDICEEIRRLRRMKAAEEGDRGAAEILRSEKRWREEAAARVAESREEAAVG
jgi:hypothetical protein